VSKKQNGLLKIENTTKNAHFSLKLQLIIIITPHPPLQVAVFDICRLLFDRGDRAPQPLRLANEPQRPRVRGAGIGGLAGGISI
jgi:hypothetical protein